MAEETVYCIDPPLSFAIPPATWETPAEKLAEKPKVRRPARLLIVGLGLGALSDTLLYGQRLGIGFALFVVACVLGLIAVGCGERQGDSDAPIRWRSAAGIGLALLFFATMGFLRSDALLAAMNVAVCLRLASLLIRAFRGDAFADLTLTDVFFGGMKTGWQTVVNAPPVFTAVQSELPTRGRVGELSKVALRGILWSLVPLGVFIALLSSADARFGQVVANVGTWLLPTDLAVRIWRAVVVGLVTFAVTGAMATASLRRTTKLSASNVGDASSAPRGVIGFPEAMFVLGSVCVVFATFVSLQFGSLFDLGSHAAVSGIVTANNARSGFYELVWVAVLALSLITAIRSGIGIADCGPSQNAFRGAASALIALTLVLLLSAVQRMAAFEDVYGATPKRVAVDTLIAFIALALLWRMATLFTSGKRPTFAAGLLVCAVGFCAAIDLRVPEAATVRANVARYQATGRIDEGMLTRSPSDDAVPALCAAFPSLPANAPLRARLAATLREKQAELRSDRRNDGWPAFNLARTQAGQAIERLGPSLGVAAGLPAAASVQIAPVGQVREESKAP